MPGVVQKKYQLTDSKLQTHEFTQNINNLIVVFKVLFLNNSVYIYISEQNNQALTDLSLVLPNADGTFNVLQSSLFSLFRLERIELGFIQR